MLLCAYLLVQRVCLIHQIPVQAVYSATRIFLGTIHVYLRRVIAKMVPVIIVQSGTSILDLQIMSVLYANLSLFVLDAI